MCRDNARPSEYVENSVSACQPSASSCSLCTNFEIISISAKDSNGHNFLLYTLTTGKGTIIKKKDQEE
ncbi:hypothetical protein KM043_016832 [Ampulex compressa]|nr:hypothetical protein KM043_016832 [Ampulex compressa]